MLFPAISRNMRENDAYYIALQVYSSLQEEAYDFMCLRHPEFISDPTLIILQISVDNEVDNLKNTAKSLGSKLV